MCFGTASRLILISLLSWSRLKQASEPFSERPLLRTLWSSETKSHPVLLSRSRAPSRPWHGCRPNWSARFSFVRPLPFVVSERRPSVYCSCIAVAIFVLQHSTTETNDDQHLLFKSQVKTFGGERARHVRVNSRREWRALKLTDLTKLNKCTRFRLRQWRTIKKKKKSRQTRWDEAVSEELPMPHPLPFTQALRAYWYQFISRVNWHYLFLIFLIPPRGHQKSNTVAIMSAMLRFIWYACSLAWYYRQQNICHCSLF